MCEGPFFYPGNFLAKGLSRGGIVSLEEATERLPNTELPRAEEVNRAGRIAAAVEDIPRGSPSGEEGNE